MLYLDGKKKDLVNALYNLVLKIPTFRGFYAWLLIGVAGDFSVADDFSVASDFSVAGDFGVAGDFSVN